MAYHQKGDLVALFDSKTVAPTMRAIARDAGQEWTRRAAAHTPQRTGRLAQGWRSLKVERTPEGGYQSGTENTVWYANIVEHGAEAHEIEVEGRTIEHPGTEPAFMLAKSAEEVEASLDHIARPHLSAWAAGLEARATEGKG